MNRTTARDEHPFIASLLLLLLFGAPMHGQKREQPTLFPINDHTAFMDIAGRVVISGSQPELVAEVQRVSKMLGGIRGTFAEESWIRFGEFSEGFATAGWALCPMCRNPQWVSGFIDETGRLIIPPKSSSTRYGDFHEGLAQYSDRSWGFIDQTGQVVIPARYYEVSDFSEGLAFVRPTEARKFGYINRQGALVIPAQFERANDFHEGLAAVLLAEGKPAFINKSGKVVLQSEEWLDISDFSEGLASVQVEVTDNSVYRGYKDRKYGFIDSTGKFVVTPRFDRVREFSEGRALFFQTGKNHGYGFIDARGSVVIAPTFADGKSFSEGLAAVALDSGDNHRLWGYIDREGSWAIKPKFQHVNSFRGGLAAVNCDEYGGNCQTYIDKTGSVRFSKARETLGACWQPDGTTLVCDRSS